MFRSVRSAIIIVTRSREIHFVRQRFDVISGGVVQNPLARFVEIVLAISIAIKTNRRYTLLHAR